MPLETATFISDLTTSNPVHTDGLSQADSHMRLTKATLKNTFPNFTAVALQATQAQLDAAVNSSVLGTAAGRFYAGTAALPGLTPIGNTNTGFWAPAANQLAVSIGGANAATWAGGVFNSVYPITAASVSSTGAFVGGTGQLVPIGAVLEWYDDVLPAEGGYAWANGQVIASANTVCPVLLARWGTRFGGNGVTTMGVPDRRETVGIGQRNMGGVAARGIISNYSVLTCNAVIGAATQTLALANLPPITAVQNGLGVTVTTTVNDMVRGSVISSVVPSGGSARIGASNMLGDQTVQSTGAINISATVSGPASLPVNILQPSTVCNYIIRIG